MIEFEFNRFKTFESFQFNHPVELNLPTNPMVIASNMASVQSGETYVLQLDEEGNFDKSYSLNDIQGLKSKYSFLLDAQAKSWPLKVEDMENYNEELAELTRDLEEGLNESVNAHLFIGFKDFGSFGWHSDEGHVACYMVSGTKLMETDTSSHILSPGDWLFMPEGLRHCATNLTDTVMISFGTGSFKYRTKTTTLWASVPSLIG